MTDDEIQNESPECSQNSQSIQSSNLSAISDLNLNAVGHIEETTIDFDKECKEHVKFFHVQLQSGNRKFMRCQKSK